MAKAITRAITNFKRIAPILMGDILRAFPKLSVLDAAAIAGNGGAESTGLQIINEKNPTVKGSRGGFGYFQWTGPRRRQFEAFCKSKGFNINTYQAQLEFLVHELKTTEKKAIPALLAKKTLEDKVVAFELAYERAGIKHYPSRISWAKRALTAWEARGGVVAPAPKPAPKPVPVPKTPKPAPELVIKPNPQVTHPSPEVAPVSTSWLMRLLMFFGIIKKPAQEVRPVSEYEGFDEVVKRVQVRLIELNYPEVGVADGLFGDKTSDAIKAFAKDNKIPGQNGDITDVILAALVRANPRAVAQHRAEATARDLRTGGNDPANALQGLGWLGQAIGLGGVLGGLNAGGVLDSIKNAADTATGTLSTIHGGLMTFINIIQWVVGHWWLFAVLIAVWMLYRVTVAVLNLVILFRHGVLQRPSINPSATVPR